MYQHQHRPLPTRAAQGCPAANRRSARSAAGKESGAPFPDSDRTVGDSADGERCRFHGASGMMKTVRVNVSSSGDVQKERNLADRLMRSIAAEFNLPVSASDLNFQRLVEADLRAPK